VMLRVRLASVLSPWAVTETAIPTG
jgi:hypothetical protein